MSACWQALGAEPVSEEERAVHAKVAAVLGRGPTILEKLREYKGCEEFIRKVGDLDTVL